MTGEGFFIVPA